MAPLAHKVAIITGACGGLGRTIAERFLEDGANVVVCDINDDLIADFREKLSPAYPECTLVLKADITEETALDELFDQAEGMFGHVDYVINNAGIMDRFDPAGTTEKAMWDRVIAINLTAPAMVTKRAVNMMVKHNTKGAIVNIASVAGFRGFAAGAAYTASKHGLVGLTKNTAAFYKTQGIRCNAILADGMQTNIGSALANGMCQEGFNLAVGGQAPEDTVSVETSKVAKLVSYLCSQDGEIMNGALVTADAGWTAT
ncbi:hypothetical protein BAUCODRAFT_149492 [Baudoinia panamericana UAMH 10762]|uniref:NAD(P)-binding protein n=1 Tax=Baudoinia panamericana (strain UAMH 10762) TaxID=717646 RepID=M2N5K2_BAUPA|nr:uncharacterized protein BAUCODRAFT_149492 [Baudoinia panamericana UAMH 10762]EMC94324.1 hypothetical protein BAUCODRAFT_149492 [Baudoinia panamericana UAMH 10762]